MARRLQQLKARLDTTRREAHAAIPEASREELEECQRDFHQWISSLEAQSRALRRLNTIRQLNRDRQAEAGD